MTKQQPKEMPQEVLDSIRRCTGHQTLGHRIDLAEGLAAMQAAINGDPFVSVQHLSEPMALLLDVADKIVADANELHDRLMGLDLPADVRLLVMTLGTSLERYNHARK